MISRREFLARNGALAAGFVPMLGAALPADNPYLKTIGLQLWTVRNQMKQDMPGTLRAIRDAGYQQVELMSVLDAEPIIARAHDLGMKVTSGFVDWQSIGNPEADGAPRFDDILELAHKFELKHLVFGYIGKGHRETADQFRRHAERANAAGERCRDAGIRLCYHNHSFEFAPLPGQTTGIDVLIAEFDPQRVAFELDVFWAQIGGRDPLKMIPQLKGRISQLHLKDLLAGTAVNYDEGTIPVDAFQELGDGVIDMAAVMTAGALAGVEQCHVEQDQSPDPLQSIVQSMTFLQHT